MNNADFVAYKKDVRSAIRQVLSRAKKGRLDEAAFPAYSHRNPLINWLFWQRVHKAIDYIEMGRPYNRILDFGCGSGVLLCFLAGCSQSVIAADVDLEALTQMKKVMQFPKNIETLDLSQNVLSTIPEGSLDLIVALDVLEHVHDLPQTVSTLYKLLAPGGTIVVSGPTENRLYKFGRRIAGKEYSGHYHERGIADIRKELAKLAPIKNIATLYWPVPLFEIFVGTKA